MPRIIDPLLFLRESLQQNKRIYRDKDYLIFEDGVKLKLETPTALVQSQTKKQYSLGSLWFYLIHRSDTLAVYLRESQKEGVDAVISLDKDKITDFFINNIDNIEIVDNDIRSKTMLFLRKKRKGDPFIEAFTSETSGENMEEGEENQTSQKSLNNLSKSDMNKHSIKKKPDDPHVAIMDYIYSNEKKSLNRNSMLKPINNILSFENLLSFSKGIFMKKGNEQKHNETLSFLEELVSGDDLRGNKAIIVVPNSFYEGNLCYENAKEFLFDSHYINLKTCTTEEKEKCNEGCKVNTFTKKVLEKDLVFEISSNVRNFSKNDWKRVVAVFVQGDDWEFKDWPKLETPTSILLKVKGFHLKYKDLPINENVKKWNVNVLEISRSKRHFDVSVQNEFWTILEEFLSQPRKR